MSYQLAKRTGLTHQIGDYITLLLQEGESKGHTEAGPDPTVTTLVFRIEKFGRRQTRVKITS